MKQLEVWKDVKGYSGIYQVSDIGNVRSVDRIVDGNRFKKGKLISQFENGCGYLKVNLWENNKCRKFYVHRLVADAFLLNPFGLPQVNHKNENKTDNSLDNLEWCDVRYNVNYGTSNSRRIQNRDEDKLSRSKWRAVYQIFQDGRKIMHQSIKSAAEDIGIKQNGIVIACQRGTSAGGYKWEYAHAKNNGASHEAVII